MKLRSEALPLFILITVAPVTESSPADAGSIPGAGRSPGGGNANALQHACLEKPMGRGAWQGTVQESSNTTERAHVHAHTHAHTHTHPNHDRALCRHAAPLAANIPESWTLHTSCPWGRLTKYHFLIPTPKDQLGETRASSATAKENKMT